MDTLGGKEHISDALKKVKVRFGKFVNSRGEGLVARAGFGTEDEIEPLRRGVYYRT